MKNEKEIINISKRQLTEQLHAQEASLLKRYKLKVSGDVSTNQFVKHEMITSVLGNISGGLGFFLRGLFYRRMFKEAGRGLIIGKGVVVRHPNKIVLGERIAIDDYSLIDAGGAGRKGLVIHDEVIISRNCVVQAKTGPVFIGQKTDIGCNVVISSVSGINIGDYVLIAGNCYIGGGRYRFEMSELSMMEQGIYSEGPVVIEDDVWLGAGVIVLDGIKIGKGSIVGAGAVVTNDLPEYSISVGIPAVVRGYRNETKPRV